MLEAEGGEESEAESEAEAIRKKKVAYQQKLAEAKKAEEQLKTTLRVILEPEAYDRLSNIRHANPNLYVTASQHALAVYKRFGQRISEQQLLNILTALKAQMNEGEKKIRFERK